MSKRKRSRHLDSVDSKPKRKRPDAFDWQDTPALRVKVEQFLISAEIRKKVADSVNDPNIEGDFIRFLARSLSIDIDQKCSDIEDILKKRASFNIKKVRDVFFLLLPWLASATLVAMTKNNDGDEYPVMEVTLIILVSILLFADMVVTFYFFSSDGGNIFSSHTFPKPEKYKISPQARDYYEKCLEIFQLQKNGELFLKSKNPAIQQKARELIDYTAGIFELVPEMMLDFEGQLQNNIGRKRHKVSIDSLILPTRTRLQELIYEAENVNNLMGAVEEVEQDLDK